VSTKLKYVKEYEAVSGFAALQHHITAVSKLRLLLRVLACELISFSELMLFCDAQISNT